MLRRLAGKHRLSGSLVIRAAAAALHTDTAHRPFTGFRDALGPTEFDALPRAIQQFHLAGTPPARCSGTFRVTRGRGICDMLASLGGLPQASESAHVVVTATGETVTCWERAFDGQPLRSTVRFAGGVVHEEFAVLGVPMRLSFTLVPTACGRGFHHITQGMWVGPLPVPRALQLTADGVTVAAADDDDGWDACITVSAPLGLGLLVRYEGRVAIEPG